MRFVLRSFEVPLVHVSIKSRVFFIRILEPNASSHLALMFFSLEGFMFSVQLFFSWLSPRLTLRHVEPHRRLRVKWNQRFCCLLHATLLCFWGEINTARPFCLLDKRRVGLQLRRRLSPCRFWIWESVLLRLYVEISSVYVWETLRLLYLYPLCWLFLISSVMSAENAALDFSHSGKVSRMLRRLVVKGCSRDLLEALWSFFVRKLISQFMSYVCW